MSGPGIMGGRSMRPNNPSLMICSPPRDTPEVFGKHPPGRTSMYVLQYLFLRKAFRSIGGERRSLALSRNVDKSLRGRFLWDIPAGSGPYRFLP